MSPAPRVPRRPGTARCLQNIAGNDKKKTVRKCSVGRWISGEAVNRFLTSKPPQYNCSLNYSSRASAPDEGYRADTRVETNKGNIR